MESNKAARQTRWDATQLHRFLPFIATLAARSSMMGSFYLIFCFLMAPLLGNSAEIHQWKDADGNVHFGDKPPSSVESTVVAVKPNVYASPSIEKNELGGSADRKVILYSAVWCGYCKKARNYFNANNIPYKEYDVEKSRKGMRDYKKLKAKGVTVILIGQRRLNGFSESSFKSIYGSKLPSL